MSHGGSSLDEEKTEMLHFFARDLTGVSIRFLGSHRFRSSTCALLAARHLSPSRSVVLSRSLYFVSIIVL